MEVILESTQDWPTEELVWKKSQRNIAEDWNSGYNLGDFVAHHSTMDFLGAFLQAIDDRILATALNLLPPEERDATANELARAFIEGNVEDEDEEDEDEDNN